MIELMPMLEAYATANIATQNLFGGNPLQVLLGDLNATAGTGAFGGVMGPQPGIITLKELVTGSMNTLGAANVSGGSWQGGGTSTGVMQVVTSQTAPLDAVAVNFQNNLGNIVIGSVMTTAGFRIANKVLSKPKAKLNKMIRQVGLGSTIQI